MKIIPLFSALALVVGLNGCTTSTDVQEMIDSANQDFREQSNAHSDSIDLLKQSSITALEKGKANAESISRVDARLSLVEAQVKLIQGYADAAKVMSAANTVKLSNLNDDIVSYKETFNKAVSQLGANDVLYEEVLKAHYQRVVESATAAMELLKMDGIASSNDAPVKLSAQIEIVAPDTSSVTNRAPAK